MKKLKLFLGLLGAAMLLPACSEDEIQGYDPGQAESDMTQYMAIQIVSPNEGSRADFDQGVWSENDVETIDFLFYDKDGVPIGEPSSFQKTDGKWYPGDDQFETGNKYENGNVSRIWTNIVPVQLIKGKNIPAQVVCAVNAGSADIQNIKGKNLTELCELKNKFNNSNFFVMTNSVYYDEAQKKVCATPVKKLYGTKEEAEYALDLLINKKDDQGNITETKPDANDPKATVVTVYVERLAAKIGLTLAKTGDKPNIEVYSLINGDKTQESDPANVSITFVPEYWFVNATSNELYTVKNYGTATTADGTTTINSADYSTVNGWFTGTTMASSWNDYANHRSYWACSPSYYSTEYPQVSDQIDDLDGNTKAYAVKYYSYNEVAAQVTSPTAITNQAIAYSATDGFIVKTEGTAGTNTSKCSGYIYTRETTTLLDNIKNAPNSSATVASAVIVGHYTVGNATEAKTFYVDRNDGNEGTFYGSDETAIAELARRQTAVYKAVTTGEGDQQTTEYKALTAEEIMGETYKQYFELSHPKLAVRRELPIVNIAGRLVTLQLKNVPTDLYYFDAKEDEFKKITADNLTQVNRNLCTSYLDKYSGGLAFFSVPIRHLGFDATKMLNEQQEQETKPVTYNWEAMTNGALGIVRNHMYNLEITKISGLATGLRDPNQPIVPPGDNPTSYVAMRLNILSWRVVPAWSVAL